MAYADYEFYTGTYRHEYMDGAISPEGKFAYLAEQASLYIRSATEGASDKVQGDDLKAVKNAMCAIAEIIQDETSMNSTAFAGGQKLSSETVGSWTRSYSTAAVSGTEVEYIDKRKLDALKLYLGGLAAFAEIFKVQSWPIAPSSRRCV